MGETKKFLGTEICQPWGYHYTVEGVFGMMKPKQPTSAYLYFNSETVTKLLKEEQGLIMTDATKRAAGTWSKFTDKEKEIWIQKNQKDVER